MTELEEYDLEVLLARLFERDLEAFHTWLVDRLQMTEDLMDSKIKAPYYDIPQERINNECNY